MAAVLPAFAYGRTGLPGHDAGYTRVTRSRRAMAVLALIHGNLLLGFGCALVYAVPASSLISTLLAAAFTAVHQGLSGVCPGCVLTPDHKEMPVRDGESEPDRLSRQVLAPRNIRSSLVHDFLHRGLDYRIEPHLFPTVPRPNPRECRPLTTAHCAEQGLPYCEVSATRSSIEVRARLRQVTEQVGRRASRSSGPRP
ncbi:fatty acid desaturase [Streptomyces roseolilacinus]|uniref:Fatty acid desaturase domain-containing protein n=1 Tax=Streptomyces roseolilacinus TaxID=66904 RepID=A0A918EJI4_9ACTN|nr:fatty acid desaturase [Streptomyces roseolilacinus]GGP97685.1 hypothetical protein GCM10010249_15250 [Streptomyces roseolilacinus]